MTSSAQAQPHAQTTCFVYGNATVGQVNELRMRQFRDL